VQLDGGSKAHSHPTAHRLRQPRQRQLPLPWQFVKPTERDKFAHPAEEELARILTFYRVRWLYEPTSFVLSRGADGRPVESFTPDFYLPDHRLYIELTTMRQSLVTRKNRKLRQLRELYPGVNIKLLYRRDVERLLSAYDESWIARRSGTIGEVVVTEAQITERVAGLAGEIATWRSERTGAESADSEPLTLLGIAPGGLIFKRELALELRERGLRVEMDRITLTRYRTPSGRKHVRLVKAPKNRVAGKEFLIVADVVSSGLSMAYLVEWLRRNGAKRVEICALFTRLNARLIDLPVRFSAFEAPDRQIVGFGVGARVAHRGLPYVATLLDPAPPESTPDE
jgi:hypoxanthine phosphoribosyltransferase